MVSIVHAVFQDGTLAEECTWQTFVLIPKGEGDFQEIGLFEVLWKAIASLLHCQVTAAISSHDIIHRFQGGQGTGTASLEAKLLQQLTAMTGAVLFKVFLYLRKSFGALDW